MFASLETRRTLVGSMAGKKSRSASGSYLGPSASRTRSAPTLRIGQIELHDRALGTSGVQHQSFRHRGRRYGHILDPRTGWPAEGVLSVSVLAPTAAEADALSTAFYVLGPQAAQDYCREHPEVAAIMFTAAEGNRWEMQRWGEGSDLLVPTFRVGTP